MRTTIAAASLVLLLATGLGNAQMRGGFGGHGGGMRGGFAARGPMVNRGMQGPVFHGSFRGRVPFAGRRGFVGTRGRFGFNRPVFCGFGGCFGSPFFGRGFHRHNRFFRYGGWGYAWPYYGYSYAPIYDYDSDYSDQSAENVAQEQRLQNEREQERIREDKLRNEIADLREPMPRTSPTSNRTASPERTSPPTTLVFRDKRKLDVQNYVIAGNYLYNADPGSPRKIALADLDVPATIKTNQERGVEFSVPK